MSGSRPGAVPRYVLLCPDGYTDGYNFAARRTLAVYLPRERQSYMHLSPAAIEGAIRLLDQPAPVWGRGEIVETKGG